MQELYIDSVAHRYGDRQIINNVYIKCGIGEIVGLLGRNGSGKSTLLKIIFGAITPSYKHLKVNGIYTHKGYRTGQVSYLPQGTFIPQKMKINTLLKLYINKYKEQLLAIDIIKNNLDVQMKDLSGGEARIIESLLIIYGDSDYVLLDEPFSQLSPLMTEELKGHILNLKDVKGFIITDHHYRKIIDISTRVVLLHNGCNYEIKAMEDLRLHGYLPCD